MIEIEAWVAAGAGLLTAGAGAVKVVGLVHAVLRQRARVQVERERSARSRVRSAELVDVVRQAHGTVRVVERTADGKRVIEVVPSRGKAREGAR